VDHSTGRALALAFRCATAMFVHMGIEWDLTAASEPELDELARWIGLHKRLRPLLHHGDSVHADHPDPAAWVHGVVASDAGHAVYAYVQLDTSPTAARPPLRLPGLRADLGYVVSVSGTPGDVRLPAWARPGEARTLPGRYLAEVGLPAPALRPGSALIVEVRSA
jgi:alpha-galactosidase